MMMLVGNSVIFFSFSISYYLMLQGTTEDIFAEGKGEGELNDDVVR